MDYDDMMQEWAAEGLVEIDGTSVTITEKGLDHPVVRLVFAHTYQDIINHLYEAGLIDLIYDIDRGSERYVATPTGLQWAELLKDMK